MVLIAESGSTKTNWVGLDGEKQVFVTTTQGLNPLFAEKSEFISVLKSVAGMTGHGPNRVCFFGAGISDSSSESVVTQYIQAVWPDADVIVHNDLVAAAIGSLGSRSGGVCILGTGMNSGVWNGESIEFKVKSVGYVLGDEGSGADIGKQFVSDLLTGNLPIEVDRLFQKTFPEEKDGLIHYIYRSENPNRYLASYLPFIADHISEPYFHNLVRSRFIALYNRCLIQYGKQLSFSFVGSVAYYFKPILKGVMREKDIVTENIMKDPMPGLVEYYKLKKPAGRPNRL